MAAAGEDGPGPARQDDGAGPVQRVPRVYLRDRQNPLNMYNERKFRATFGFSKENFRAIFHLFENEIRGERESAVALQPVHKFSIFMEV